MPRVLRIVLLWLVALAVPVQGLAAATMLHCGPAHAGSIGAKPSHGSHAHSDAGRHVHEAAAGVQTTAQNADADETGKTVADLHKLSKSKCASCSACCTTTALPAASIAFDSPLLAESLVAVDAVSVAVFLTEGPERPPRAFLA